MDDLMGNGSVGKGRGPTRMTSRRLITPMGLLAVVVMLVSVATASQGLAAEGNWAQQAELLLGMGRYPEAVDMFTRAIDKEGLKSEFLLGRGLARLYAGKLELAEEDLTRAIEMGPGSPQAFTALGTVRFQRGHYSAALEDYSRALAADENYAPAYNQLAWLLATAPDEKLRNAERALEMAQKAVDLDPNIHYQDTLAAALAAAGKYTQAVIVQKEVLRGAIQADRTDGLEAYTARLKHYEEGQAWHLAAVEKKEEKSVGEAKTTAAAPPALAAQPETPPVVTPPAPKPEIPPVVTPPAPKPQPEETPAASPAQPVAQPPKASPADTPAPVPAKPRAQEVKPVKPPEPAIQPEREAPAITAQRTTPAAAPPRKPPPVLTPKPRPYTIQVSSYPDRQRSHRTARELRTKGDVAFTAPTIVQGKGLQHRIFIGYYGQIKEARAAAEQLKKRNFRRTDIVIKPYAVQISRSDSPLELDHLEAELEQQGYLAYRLPDLDQHRMMRLLLGAYGTEPEALTAVKELRARGYKPKIVAR